MFLKPFRVKSSSQMKGSDKKKFKAEVRKKFHYFTDPDNDQDALNDLVPNKEELIVTKIETFNGDSVLLYSKNDDGTTTKVTLFFELEKEKSVYPTLWTLWQLPRLLPTMTTYDPVVSKIANGADLMLPGVIVNDSLGIKAYGKIEKGDIHSVNLLSNKAPVAVGNAALSSEDMYMSGKRGKALMIKHCLGDYLWQHDGAHKLPNLGVPENLSFLEDLENVTENTENLALETEAMTEETSEATEDVVLDEPEMQEKEEVVIDDILEEAFIRACKTLPKKTEFPILTSNFFRTHIIGALPPHCSSLDIKKTKWKKLSKFLAEKQTQGFLTIKEPKKGVEVISDIKAEHPDIVKYRVIKYEKVENDEINGGSKKNVQEFQPPIIEELYIVTGNEVALFFKDCQVPKGSGLSPQQVRELIRSYVNKNQLQNPDDKTIINLDPVLAQAVLVKGENNVLTFKWDKITSRITNKMSKGYSIEYSGHAPIIVKGKLEPIEMTLASRSGNKKVTLIHNLDVYGIDPQEFGHKCQVGVAASSTVNEAPNKKKANGNPVIEVLVQGNQVAFAGKLLSDHYKIPKKYIRGLELAVKKKK